MKAMILAAGLGTRLKPFTDENPKALLPVGGKPMLQRVAEKLIHAGVTYIVVNIHHHPEKMKKFISGLRYPGVTFYISDETQQLLDTGGGVKKAEKFLKGEQPFFVYNSDVLCDIDLKALSDFHLKSKALATLAVTSRESSRYFLWDDNRLSGWENTKTGEKILLSSTGEKPLKRMAFSGIHVLSPSIFEPMEGKKRFSINQVYLRLAQTHLINCFEHDEKFWADLGTPEKLARAETLIRTQPKRFH